MILVARIITARHGKDGKGAYIQAEQLEHVFCDDAVALALQGARLQEGVCVLVSRQPSTRLPLTQQAQVLCTSPPCQRSAFPS